MGQARCSSRPKMQFRSQTHEALQTSWTWSGGPGTSGLSHRIPAPFAPPLTVGTDSPMGDPGSCILAPAGLSATEAVSARPGASIPLPGWAGAHWASPKAPGTSPPWPQPRPRPLWEEQPLSPAFIERLLHRGPFLRAGKLLLVARRPWFSLQGALSQENPALHWLGVAITKQRPSSRPACAQASSYPFQVVAVSPPPHCAASSRVPRTHSHVSGPFSKLSPGGGRGPDHGQEGGLVSLGPECGMGMQVGSELIALGKE